ncbi:MAG: hypothetical protein OEQ18_14315 [Gammaproteobacteria bacterium]|nr:hypothetical protein [Gammaproteobacteria bacterium]
MRFMGNCPKRNPGRCAQWVRSTSYPGNPTLKKPRARCDFRQGVCYAARRLSRDRCGIIGATCRAQPAPGWLASGLFLVTGIVLENLDKTTFEPHLHTTFRICPTDGDALRLELIEVKGLGGDAAPAATRAPFSILFLGPAEPLLAQRIYRIEHPELAPMELFLVPVGPGDGGMNYEAVFS